MDSYYDGPLSEYARSQGHERGPAPEVVGEFQKRIDELKAEVRDRASSYRCLHDPACSIDPWPWDFSHSARCVNANEPGEKEDPARPLLDEIRARNEERKSSELLGGSRAGFDIDFLLRWIDSREAETTGRLREAWRQGFEAGSRPVPPGPPNPPTNPYDPKGVA